MDIDGISYRKNVTVIGVILLEIRLLPLRCIFVWQMDQFFFFSVGKLAEHFIDRLRIARSFFILSRNYGIIFIVIK